MFLFILLTALAVAENLIDYQLYTNSVGSEYSRVHFPEHGNKTIVNFNSRSSYSPVVTKHQDKIIAEMLNICSEMKLVLKKFLQRRYQPLCCWTISNRSNFER